MRNLLLPKSDLRIKVRFKLIKFAGNLTIVFTIDLSECLYCISTPSEVSGAMLA